MSLARHLLASSLRRPGARLSWHIGSKKQACAVFSDALFPFNVQGGDGSATFRTTARSFATQRSTRTQGKTTDEPTASGFEKVSLGEAGTHEIKSTDSNDQPSMVDYLPSSMQPYARLARLDKPIGTMLLLWPCCWSTAIAAPLGSGPDLKLLGLFAAGSFIMRGAGCTINDMWDADFDKSVARTKTRPLASGELTHKQALGFLAVQLSAGLGVLLSLPNTWYCFQLGAASLPFVVSYPLMKRFTNWPQLVLGITFNWGAFMGWAATHGSLDFSVIGPLYCSGIAWTLVYDTLYAHQDKVDDSKLGLKSTALYFGEHTKPILHCFAALAMANWSLAGYAVGYESPLYYAGCSLAWAHLAWQINTAILDEPENLADRFRKNNQVGAIVFASCAAGSLAAAAL
mmetsp:Transcript_994/g.2847  ORF Transcript_994/g.2847 Transcript_994/m.2847 type:complete len:401 (-) Transcript_994:88-1290(-)